MVRFGDGWEEIGVRHRWYTRGLPHRSRTAILLRTVPFSPHAPHPTPPDTQSIDPPPPPPRPISKTKLMDPLWPHIVILRATHETLTQPLIHPKHHLRRDLRAQERRLLRPHVLPLREILRHPGDLDACGRLVVAGLFGQVLRPVVGVVLLELELLVQT